MRKLIIGLIAAGCGGVALAVGFLWSGIYNIGADDEHWPLVYRTLGTLRERSVTVRANRITVPALDDPALIRQGAGNYQAMCVGCHLAPGQASSEMSRGLYPRPPQLASPARKADAAHDFWVIKHGIKASGMPAWGKSMEDAYIWGLAAFVRKLPTLSPEQYRALVAASGGHAHGGGEDHQDQMPHSTRNTATHTSRDEQAPAAEAHPHPHPPGHAHKH